MTIVRKIVHIDMDAFYASVEQRDDPRLRGKPVVVAWRGNRSVVCAASYEARRYGVHSAMPATRAERLCPEAVFLPPDFLRYRAVSRLEREIFKQHTDLIEPLSLDEAYLDVTEPLQDLGSATAIAEEIRRLIRAETGLTASAGISYNKLLAKLASDHRKPDGIFVITPRLGPAFVEELKVEKFHGIGPATAAKMNGLGIATGRDLRARSLEFLRTHFGKAGAFYYSMARGEDPRPVEPDRERKSLGAETTFARDLWDEAEMRAALDPLIAKVWVACENENLIGRTVTLKAKFADFHQITRSRTLMGAVTTKPTLEYAAIDLLRGILPVTQGVRLLGVTVANFAADERQGVLELDLSSLV